MKCEYRRINLHNFELYNLFRRGVMKFNEEIHNDRRKESARNTIDNYAIDQYNFSRIYVKYNHFFVKSVNGTTTDDELFELI